ncbi:flavodoxin [Desulfobulbus rhabdoformis]|jgi:flavodoxin short chain|uniref:flavodoxin n=1 Tax=Desulfobulbus rhabdoformis TaxID=34032 RepID=UPI0019643DA7|nr:flavodoxin [Desulfobulbus rhabdoformis]MBM9612836.1 flavodoxin [Desulfobulbus rhabdoformis]
MAKTLIVYGSTTGNTETTAIEIGNVLGKEGHEVVLQDVSKSKVEDLGNGYDLTLLGSSTWGDDEIEFQEDFASFFEEMDNADLKDKKVAVFGCGDSTYTYFCGAVDELQAKVESLGGKVVVESLKIDGDPGDVTDEIVGWAQEVAAAL